MVCLTDSKFPTADSYSKIKGLGFKTKDWQINGTFKYFKLK